LKESKITLIAGVGIGPEAVPEGVHVIEAAARRRGISFGWDERPWGCEGLPETPKATLTGC
jgi:isocitrate/isopropylmalate dehydrogenase